MVLFVVFFVDFLREGDVFIGNAKKLVFPWIIDLFPFCKRLRNIPEPRAEIWRTKIFVGRQTSRAWGCENLKCI